MARTGRRVVLVDADLRHPRLHELFGVPDRTGLTSLLIGDATTVEALQPVAGLDSLVVLPVGPRPPNPSELLTSLRFGEVIGRLRDSGLTVIIDSPPVLEGSDGLVVAAASNAAVLGDVGPYGQREATAPGARVVGSGWHALCRRRPQSSRQGRDEYRHRPLGFEGQATNDGLGSVGRS